MRSPTWCPGRGRPAGSPGGAPTSSPGSRRSSRSRGSSTRSLLDVPERPEGGTALDLERAAVSADPDVRKVESAKYGDSVGRVAIGIDQGRPAGVSAHGRWASVAWLAERDGETQTGFAFRLARELDELDWRAAAEEAADRAARLLGARKPRSERVPVVLDPEAATSFLGVLAGALSAEAVLKGRSLFASSVDQSVASDLVTLVDDGRLLEGSAAAPFDDEGVATGRTPVVENGVLRGFLHNTYTATQAGTVSTGNAGRAGTDRCRAFRLRTCSSSLVRPRRKIS